jgi:outer membrane protein assembly factor BamD
LFRTLRAPALTLSAILVASLSASGCALFRDRTPDEPVYQERPVEVLYSVAGLFLDSGQFETSILYFQEVERQHPYSDWARRSVIMAAFAAYRQGNYPLAISEANRYIQLYPGTESSTYAYYLIAMSYYEQIVDVGRDQGATEQARSALNEVVSRFPGSAYAADARLKLDRVDDHLAGKEMEIGRFYLRRGDTLAAISRFKNVIDTYQTTSHAPEALYRLVEAYLTVGVVEEANRNAAVLGANYPGSEWYADAYGLMTGRGVQPAVAPTAGPRRLRNLFGLLPRGDEPLPSNPQETLSPPEP